MTTSPGPSYARSGPATLGDFIAVAKKTRAKSRPPPLWPIAGLSSGVESAHRGAHSQPRRKVARACERVCGVRCNLRVARERVSAQNAAVEEAIAIATREEAEW